jgi:SpoVK/Ycf46/Vps4 family AAA+-type ATPase
MGSSRGEDNHAPQITKPGLPRYIFDQAFPKLHRSLTKIGALSEPPELKIFEDYLGELRGKIDKEFQNKRYLIVSAREAQRSALDDAAKARSPRLIRPILREARGLAHGGDAATAQIAAVNRRSRVVRNIVSTLGRTNEPLILLGDAGTGKTMTLQHIAKTFAEWNLNRVFPTVPLYVRLGEFRKDEDEVRLDDVLSFIKKSVPLPIREWIDELDDSKRLIILFDGMDEMSRRRYNEHTEALSVFASSRQGRSKTLFSCRITDFSPRFVHRRLVLLPFNRSQIAEYLRLYIRQFPLLVEGKKWTPVRLAKRLTKGDLPIDASNPFVLWLLCLYLVRNFVWPTSRVDLLGFYCEETYERKAADIPIGEPPFPQREQIFLEWARFAYEIISANRGTTIPVADLYGGDNPERIGEYIRVGERCGILEESSEGQEHLLRFKHHRFEEYFAALYIQNRRLEIQWLDKLDAPRWQETIFNLVEMGSGDGAVATLSTAIADTATSEAIRADRVELASRIIRQVSPNSSLDLLLANLTEAMIALADNGNPISQVQMMRAAQNLPETDIVGVLKRPLTSRINWVRNQALITLASRRTSATSIGSDFATEIGYELANGTLLGRLSSYYKAGLSAGRSRSLACLFLGILSSGLNLFGLLGFAALLYLSAMRQFPDFNPLLWRIIYGSFIVLAIGVGLFRRPPMLWRTVLWASATSLLLLGLVAASLRGVSPPALLGIILAATITGYILSPFAIAGAAIIHFASLFTYLFLSIGIRTEKHRIKSIFRSGWRNCGFADAFSYTLRPIVNFLLSMATIFLVVSFIRFGISVLDSLCYKLFHAPLALVACILVCISLGGAR